MASESLPEGLNSQPISPVAIHVGTMQNGEGNESHAILSTSKLAYSHYSE